MKNKNCCLESNKKQQISRTDVSYGEILKHLLFGQMKTQLLSGVEETFIDTRRWSRAFLKVLDACDREV